MNDPAERRKRVTRNLQNFWNLVISFMAFGFAYDAFYTLSHPGIPGDHLRAGPIGNRILGVIFIAGGIVYLYKGISGFFKKEKPSEPK